MTELDRALLCVEELTEPGSWERSALTISALMEHRGDPMRLAQEVVRLRGLASMSLETSRGVTTGEVDQAVFPPGTALLFRRRWEG